jgi:hypothetical protein
LRQKHGQANAWVPERRIPGESPGMDDRHVKFPKWHKEDILILSQTKTPPKCNVFQKKPNPAHGFGP